MFEKFRPVGKRLLLKLLEKAEHKKTSAGIIVNTYIDGNREALVVACGDKISSIKVNDKVYFCYMNSVRLDEEYVVIDEDHILGVIQE